MSDDGKANLVESYFTHADVVRQLAAAVKWPIDKTPYTDELESLFEALHCDESASGAHSGLSTLMTVNIIACS